MSGWIAVLILVCLTIGFAVGVYWCNDHFIEEHYDEIEERAEALHRIWQKEYFELGKSRDGMELFD